MQMTVKELLSVLRERKVAIRAEAGQLRVSAPEGALTPDIQDQIRLLKADLITYLSGHLPKQGGTGVIEPVSREGPLPVSFAQERLWFLDQYEEDTGAYDIPVTFQLVGSVDAGALRRSVDELVARHEILRTTFPSKGGTPFQAISADVEGAWEWGEEDISGLTDDAEVRRRIEAEVRRPFDLEQGPLLRVCLFHQSESRHLLQVTMHHIVSDGWTTGIFNRELSEVYGALVRGEESPLSELPIQYGDFAVWQREWLQGEMLETQLSYWRNQLADVKPLQLPTDRPRPAIQTFSGRGLRVQFEAGLVEGLEKLSRAEGTTLYMTLMAAFQLLLHRYSGQTDLAVGTPIAGRRRPEVEGLMGVFINTLVVRSRLEGDLTFRELLAQVRATALAAQAHQDLPFEKLVEELQPDRDLSRNPLFQAMFAYQNMPGEHLSLPGVEVAPYDLDQATSMVDLTLWIWETGGDREREGLAGTWEFSTDLFDEATIRRMQGHFRNLLEGIVADPARRLSELELLGEDERERALVDWNDTAVPFPSEARLHDLFESQVDRTPEAVALRFGGKSLTYAQLNGRANQLSRVLKDMGVEPGALVGLGLERSLEMVVGLLGILKTGAAYVPLDPAFPPERLRFMVEDAELAALVSTSELAEGLGVARERQLLLDADAENLARQSDGPLEPDPELEVRPEDPAYVIFTSGSTGRPKGVIVPHRAVVNFLCSMAETPGISADDVLLAVTTLSFDISVLELFGPLSVGGQVVLVSSEEAASGEELKGRVEKSGATVMQATPASWRMLFDAGWKGNPGFRVLVGGEALPLDLARELAECCGEVWNMYGPTETTVWSSCWRVPKDVEQVRIGRPIGNTQLYVLDGRMQPTPIGVPGELYIGGSGVTQGYLSRPELTEERFLDDPFRREPGARLYRTGDLARFGEDGVLECLGRLDNQVKVRGFRIELGEIEAVLVEADAVKQAVVGVVGAGTTDANLVAYVVVEDGATFGLSEMRSILRTRVPDYMVPSLLIELDAFPLTPNGKVDRKALPDPEILDPSLEEAYVAPRSSTEETLAIIWADILGRERIGIHDDFFTLGGHSLLATQVVSRIHQDLGVQIRLRALFAAPTIADLSLTIAEEMVGDTDLDDLSLILEEIEGLSSDELGVLFDGESSAP
jgi:amino acid adenylation domain-containing protein